MSHTPDYSIIIYTSSQISASRCLLPLRSQRFATLSFCSRLVNKLKNLFIFSTVLHLFFAAFSQLCLQKLSVGYTEISVLAF